MDTNLIKWKKSKQNKTKKKIKKKSSNFHNAVFLGPILLIKLCVIIVCSCIKWDCIDNSVFTYVRTAVGKADGVGTESIGAKKMSRSIPSLVMTPTRQTPPELPSKYIACQTAENRKKCQIEY